ncbi:MAG: Gfo/Idh/MocA family oxidoreductase [Chloroflexi bacterium]|nr:Gfo/Idh/MocA family oxidoreductase [Chloroflexota bacterium]
MITKICMIGAGRVGKLHSGNLRRYIPSGEVVALVDTVPEMLKETGEEFGIEARFTSLEEAIDKADFDAVVITTPTPSHLPLAVTAAEAGKHVFLEKPMAMDLEECDKIINACKSNSVHLQLGFMRHFDPDFALAYERIQAGEIGEPMLVKSLTHGPGLPPPWARDLKTSNGNLAEVNSHDLDATRWLMGSNPARIYVEVSNFKGAERGVDTENYYDNMIANLKFESGGLGSISGVCPCDYGYDARMEIIGKKGIMIVGELKGNALTVGIDRDTGLVTPIFRRWPDRFYIAYIHEIEHFIESIQNDTQPKVSGEDGRWAVAGVLAGTKSFLEERPVLLSEVMHE